MFEKVHVIQVLFFFFKGASYFNKDFINILTRVFLFILSHFYLCI